MSAKKNVNRGLSPATVAIEKAILAIPPGRVSTYGRIALSAGFRNGARQVVRVLHSRTEAAKLPWHRVLGRGKKPALAKISLTGAGFAEQCALLASEGVEVAGDGSVDLERFGM